MIFISACLALSLAGCVSDSDKNNETTKQADKPSQSVTQNDITNADNSASDDISALALSAKNKIKFVSELEDQGDAPLYTYSMDSCASAAAGWCAMSGTEQIAVFKITDGKQKEAEEKAKAYIDYLIDGYSSYGPQEVPKLKKAVIKTYGDILVVCVSDDDDMQKALDAVFVK